MSLDHEAIRKAYPDAVTIDDTHGAFKLDGTKIDIVQSTVDAARVELNKLNYRGARRQAYTNIGDQLDNLYKDILAGKVDSTGEFAKAIKAVKDAHPKP